MDAFEFQASPCRVIFGTGTTQKVSAELTRLGLSKPLIVCSATQARKAEGLRSTIERGSKVIVAGIFASAQMHTPVEQTEKGTKLARAIRCDSLVSLGGGSAIGLGKAISFRTGIYHLAVPTTYAGSEMTPILGETRDGKKTTMSDPKIRPGTVVYDIDLTMTLPAGLSATSGVNAIAHAVEALYAFNSNPLTNLVAREGARALAEALPGIVKNPSSRQARSKALYGAWLCGTCLGSVGMSLHHKLCHTLGGSCNLPHAEIHTIVLPHALAYNAPKVPAAMEALADALPDSDGDAIRGLNVLLQKLGVKRGLRELGIEESDVSRAADMAVGNPYWNPREIERSAIHELIRRAWAGEPARQDL